MSPVERAEHKRKLTADRQYAYRIRFKQLTRGEKRARRQSDSAQLYRWERILPYIVKSDGGCWHWHGSFKIADGRLRPWARAGVFGGGFVDFVVCCLHRGRPPPNCFVSRVCETIDCVSPEHLVWSNQTVQRAKRRMRHEQENLGRVE